MNELPIFFKLLKKNLFLYSLLTNQSLDTTHLKKYDFDQHTPSSVQISGFMLSDEEVFSSMTASLEEEGGLMLDFIVNDDRFLNQAMKYFGKDSFLRIRNKDPEMTNSFTEVRSKIIYLTAFDKPLKIWVRSSPHFGNSLTIFTENHSLVPAKGYRSMDDQTLLKYFEASAIGELQLQEQNEKRGQNQMWLNTMERIEELHARGRITLLEPLLTHEHPNVRRWAASVFLLIDEEKAKAVLENLSIIDSFNGDEARRVLKDWGNGKSQFDFLRLIEE